MWRYSAVQRFSYNPYEEGAIGKDNQNLVVLLKLVSYTSSSALVVGLADDPDSQPLQKFRRQELKGKL